MKTRILSLLLVCVVIFSTAAFAQPGERGEQWDKLPAERKALIMKKRQAMQKKLHQEFFTEEQKEAMKNLHLEAAKEAKPLKSELRELMAHQQTLTTADKADLNAINKNIDKMSSVKAVIAKILAKQHQEVRSLLTEEQLLKFDAMKQHRNKTKRNRVPH